MSGEHMNGKGMSGKDKLLVVGVLFAIAVGFLGHHYWAVAVKVLERLVAVGVW